MSGTKMRSTEGSSVVLMKLTMRSSAPALLKVFLKKRKSSFVIPMPPRTILSDWARKATIAITSLNG